MTICYKAVNMVTKAMFARRLLRTNPPTESHAKTASQVVKAAERDKMDAAELRYDFQNPLVVCGAAHVSIYAREKKVGYPYCGVWFMAVQEERICGVCDLAVVGAGASGLRCLRS